jgi:hypothetical protein|tara:strand:+ start:760 stop:969 length:210 start_codon:yes stop_codon:yes gene_type:complete
MTSAINTQKSENLDNSDGMDGFSNKKLQLIDIVENIDDLSNATVDMQITRNEYLNCLREVTKNKILDIK